MTWKILLIGLLLLTGCSEDSYFEKKTICNEPNISNKENCEGLNCDLIEVHTFNDCIIINKEP